MEPPGPMQPVSADVDTLRLPLQDAAALAAKALGDPGRIRP